ncbi:MAG TPA: hypothetical protein VGF75_06400, partial [Candidatus Saccharimonadales bacterium]
NSDRTLVAKARASGQKTNLVFELPAPTILDSSLKSLGSLAKFTLRNNILTITASGLKHLSYPLTIDPSVVDSASGLLLGNGQGDLSYTSSANDIQTTPITGGVLASSWTEQNNSTGTGYSGSCGSSGGAGEGQSVAYNDFLYTMGGVCNINSVAVYTVDYATITPSTGAISGWTSTTSIPSGDNDYVYFDATAYNGYIYILGGGTNTSVTSGTLSSVVLYALICTGNNNGVSGCGSTAGTIGTWNTTTSLPTVNANFGLAVYNNYLYITGGWTSLFFSDLDYVATTYYAPINSNGTIGTWQTGPSLPSPEAVTMSEYNGYLYAVTNCDIAIPNESYNCPSAATTEYAQVQANGDLSSWQSTGARPSEVEGASLMASNGYLYVIGGYNASATIQSVLYAPINADGTVGSVWTTTTSIPAFSGDGREYAMTASYNGYLYLTGGVTVHGSNYAYDTVYTQAGPAGTTTISSIVPSNEAFPAGAIYTSSAVNNNYIYVLGACSTSSCSSISQAMYYSNIGSGALSQPSGGSGCTGVWCTTTATYTYSAGAALVAYDGNLTIIGGCKTYTTDCTAAAAGDVYAQPGSSGNVSSWTTDSADLSSARALFASAVYGNFVYIIGGLPQGSGTGIQNVAFAELSPTGGLVSDYFAANACSSGSSIETWCDSTTNKLPLYNSFSDAFAYNGYLYSAGGIESGAATAHTYFTKINSSTGSLSCPGGTCTGVWEATTALPTTNY